MTSWAPELDLAPPHDWLSERQCAALSAMLTQYTARRRSARSCSTARGAIRPARRLREFACLNQTTRSSAGHAARRAASGLARRCGGQRIWSGWRLLSSTAKNPMSAAASQPRRQSTAIRTSRLYTSPAQTRRHDGHTDPSPAATTEQTRIGGVRPFQPPSANPRVLRSCRSSARCFAESPGIQLPGRSGPRGR